MKRIYGLFIGLIFSAGLFAQVQPTPYLQISIYLNQLTPSCNLGDVLANGDTVYMHSGLDWYTPIPQSPDSIWQSIVGHWGINDGIGEMTHVGTASSDTFSITINIKDYYYTYADPPVFNEGATGVGPMNQDSTPYNIGMVFRIGTCQGVDILGKPECTPIQTGKDENCKDIFILGLPNPNADSSLNVYDYGYTSFTGVGARYVATGPGATSGIRNLNSTENQLTVSPTPFTAQTSIKFALGHAVQPKLEIFNLMGQKITDLSSNISNGYNSIVWNGTNSVGNVVPAGIYLVQITNGSEIYSAKIIKQ